MLKWAVVSKFENRDRFKVLSDFLSDQSIENELEIFEPEIESFENQLDTIKSSFDAIRIGSPYAKIIADDVENTTSLVLSSKSVDCLVKLDGKWWPRLAIEKGYERVLSRGGADLDIHNKVLIIGTGVSAKAAINPLVGAGYTRISFTDINEDRGQEFIDDLSKRVFNLELEFIRQKDITLLPGTYSAVINTTPDIESNTLIQDLTYFNYLMPAGFVLDINIQKGETGFIKQALVVNSQVVSGIRLAAETDMFWLELVTGKPLDVVQYEERLMESFSE
ncbi:MAG: hypothetical protein AB8E15_09895 [Bdellovibrionales bacterium]